MVAVGHGGPVGRPSIDAPERMGSTITSGVAAKVLGIAERHVRRLLRSGDVAGRRCGSRWLLQAESVDNLAALRGVLRET